MDFRIRESIDKIDAVTLVSKASDAIIPIQRLEYTSFEPQEAIRALRLALKGRDWHFVSKEQIKVWKRSAKSDATRLTFLVDSRYQVFVDVVTMTRQHKDDGPVLY
jgi:hypothetical protein